MIRTKTLKALRAQFLTGAAIGILMGAGTAGAQQAPPDQALEEIVVTGSRIARPELTSSSPVAVVSNEALRLSGNVNVEQVLNEMPQVVPGATTTSNNPGAGIASVDLRGLGPSRTLVLVNGRRFVASTQGATVDINNIPAALVERVEVVTGGASAVYGSDAIAGVVNFILRDDFEGAEVTTQYGITEEGDGDTLDVSATLGGNFADGRGNAVVFVNYFDRQDVFAGDREFSSIALQDGTNDAGETILEQGGSSGIPGLLIFDEATIGGTLGSVTFSPDQTPRIFQSPEDLYNFAPINYLQVPQERWAVTGMATYEIADFVEAYVETNFINNQVPQQLAPTPALATVQVNLDNPILTPANQALFAENFGVDTDGDGVVDQAEFFIGRRLSEVGPRISEDEYNAYRIVSGLRGDLPGTAWNYDAYYSYGRVKRINRLENDASFSRLQQALQATTDADGNVVCVDPSGGCVPIDIFGEGRISPEAAEFIRISATNTTEIEEQVASASVAGEVFELPAGGLGTAVGVEWRKVESVFAPDEFLASGDVLGFNAGAPTAGEFDVWEVFGELLVPILSDVPFAEELSLEAGLRYSDYSTVGSIWTYKAGGEWQPIEDVRVRGLYQRAVRAPNIADLYTGESQGFPAYTDPCDADQNPLTTPGVAELCVAQGIPLDRLGSFQQANTQVEASFTGNPDLEEETSDTWTIGAVLTPRWLPDFTATVDYYNITLEDAIGSFGGGAANIVNLCFQSGDINSPFCQAFSRRPDLNIDVVEVPQANVAELQTEGIDVQFNYGMDLPQGAAFLGDAASLDLAFLGTYVLEYKFLSFAEAEFIECAGTVGAPCPGPGGTFVGTGTPEWKATTTATYTTGPLSFQVQWRWIDSLQDARIAAGTPADQVAVEETGAVHYFDLSFQYAMGEMFQFFGGVNNLMDRRPPILGDAAVQSNTDPSLFDVIGRRYFVGLSARF